MSPMWQIFSCTNFLGVAWGNIEAYEKATNKTEREVAKAAREVSRVAKKDAMNLKIKMEKINLS